MNASVITNLFLPPMDCVKNLIHTSNHMFGRANWDKLPKWIFENFEIARLKRGQFQIFQKPRG